MKVVVPVLIAVGLAVAPTLATAQDTNAKVPVKTEAEKKHFGRISSTDKSTDIAASKADADAKAHNAAALSNKSSNEAKQAQIQAAKSKATGGSSFVKSFNHNQNVLKIGDINNANVNDNKQSVTIGVPVRK